MLSSFSPRAKRSRLAATALQRRSAVASVLLELCGVIRTFGNSWNGRRDGRRSGSSAVGYCHHTSSAAPPRWPSYERSVERLLVDDGRPRDIDQQRTGVHQGEATGVDQSSGFRREAAGDN